MLGSSKFVRWSHEPSSTGFGKSVGKLVSMSLRSAVNIFSCYFKLQGSTTWYMTFDWQILIKRFVDRTTQLQSWICDRSLASATSHVDAVVPCNR